MVKTFKVVQARKTNDGVTFWLNLGIALQKEQGISVKLNSLPLPNDSGEVWLQLYEKEENNEISQKNVERSV